MSLSVAQSAALTAVQTDRAGQDALIWTMQKDLSAAAKLLVPTAVAHNRTKISWRLGEKATIFLSEDDSNKVNGFYFSWYGVEPINLLDNPRGLVGVIGCQYLYQYSFGDDGANSEKTFIENMSTFIAGLSEMRNGLEIAGKPFAGWSGDAILTDNIQPKSHFFNGRLRFLICSL